MAQNAISASPSIFLQGGQLYQNANSKIFDAISQAADMYQKIQMQRDANLQAMREKQMEIDLAKQKMAAEQQKAQYTDEGFQALAAKGADRTPAEEQAFQSGLAFRQSQVAQNPLTGSLYPKFQGSGIYGADPQPAPQSVASAMAPVAQDGQGILPPPRTDGKPGTVADFMALGKSNQTNAAPSPIGSNDEKLSIPTVTDEIKTSPAMQAKKTEEDIKTQGSVAVERAKKQFDFEQQQQIKQQAKEDFQKALDDLYAKNEELDKAGALLDEKRGFVKNLKNAATGVPVAGYSAEVVADPEKARLRQEYETLRASALQAYKKAAGVTGGEMNTPAEYNRVMQSLGAPNQFYKANRSGLESVSKRYGTGSFGGKKEGSAEVTQYKEGQTAINPKTGERMVFKGGKWQAK